MQSQESSDHGELVAFRIEGDLAEEHLTLTLDELTEQGFVPEPFAQA